MRGVSVSYNDDYTKCQAVVSVSANGERVRYKKTFYSNSNLTKTERKKNLEDQVMEFRNKIKDDDYLPGEKTTFKDFVAIFIEKYAKKELSPTTTTRYIQLLNRAKESPLGNKYLSKIRPIDLIEFYESLEEKQTRKLSNGRIQEYYLSSQTILHHQRAISIVLSKAKYWQYIKENVAERVENVKVRKKEEEVLDISDLKRMLKMLEKEDIIFRTIISLLIYTGLRRSEACGLEWKDIDFERKTLKVKRNIVEVGGKIIEKLPKTYKSIRTITLSDSIIKILMEYKEWQSTVKKNLRCY